MYFGVQTGAPHAARWSKSLFSMLKQVFPCFSVTNEKKNSLVRFLGANQQNKKVV